MVSGSERALQEESRLKGYRVETAKNIWAKGQTLATTLAERYLVEHRGIPPEVIPRSVLIINSIIPRFNVCALLHLC